MEPVTALPPKMTVNVRDGYHCHVPATKPALNQSGVAAEPRRGEGGTSALSTQAPLQGEWEWGEGSWHSYSMSLPLF